jgi:hypothetical protein
MTVSIRINLDDWFARRFLNLRDSSTIFRLRDVGYSARILSLLSHITDFSLSQSYPISNKNKNPKIRLEYVLYVQKRPLTR